MREIGQSVVTREPIEADVASAPCFMADDGNRLFCWTECTGQDNLSRTPVTLAQKGAQQMLTDWMN